MIPSLSFALICGLSTLASGSPSLYSATWSPKAYGPDGPWQAIEAELGSNAQSVALYPGDKWASLILLDSVCSTPNITGECLADNAGTFNLGTSDTSYIASSNSNDTSDMSWVEGSSNYYLNKFGGNLHALAAQVGDTIKVAGLTVSNISMTAVYEAYQTYSNGVRYPVEVGTFSLGGTKLDHVVDGVDYNLFEAYNWEEGFIPSYSWGMHIGSVTPPISGSLVLGGYDSSRIVGNVSSQPVNSTDSLGTMETTLYDIGLGVAQGASPWSFGSMEGLFRQDGSSGSRPTTVQFDPLRPYLYLPGDACSAIAEQLPVYFDSGLNLYFWNTSNYLFSNITESPAYLSFTFENNGGADSASPNITIKVPFNLLRLTLQPPLVEQNTTYFPCFPSDDFTLGRAFLQAAFIGTNWHNGTGSGTWFFAQAPGPVLTGNHLQEIYVSDTNITGSSSSGSWESSWSGWWTPLDKTYGNGTDGNGNGGHGGDNLSYGAKIGIGIGCGAAGALILCIAWLLVSRYLKKRKQVPATDADAAGGAGAPDQDHARELQADDATELSGPLLSEAAGLPRYSTSERAAAVPSVSEHYTETGEIHGVEGDKPPPWSPPAGEITIMRNLHTELQSGEVAAELR
ncbi:hypothetical protein N7528_001634 [Penicillium herquei]|nr:hypothetical protein N7528_001634 [Penicillium herquei]